MRYIAMGFILVLAATFIGPIVKAAGSKMSAKAEDAWEENNDDTNSDGDA
jgi:hypothetical protein